MLSEKALKIILSFLIIYFLKKDGLIELLATYALIEMTSITMQTFSIFGTDILSQREMKKDGTHKLNLFISARFLISIIIFFITISFLNNLISESFTLMERIVIASFLFLSPFQSYEYYLYSINKFDKVYISKIISYLISFIVKILVLHLHPKLIIFTISLDFLILFFIYYFLMNRHVSLSFSLFDLNAFYKKYFFKVLLLFSATIFVTLNNQVLFSMVKVGSSTEVVAELYIFIKIAEGLNFLSTNIALMTIPNFKGQSIFLKNELKKLIKNYKLIVVLMVSLFLFFHIIFSLYDLSNLYLAGILGTLLFIINSYQTFIGINMVFKKKETYKLIMNVSTFLVLFSLLFINSDFANYYSIILILIIAKLVSILFTIVGNYRAFELKTES